MTHAGSLEPSVIIVGGGFAGLAAAVELAAAKVRVVLLEARSQLGGRATSRFDPAFGCHLDNGQHAMMGCYHETLAFLHRIGAQHKLVRQTDLRVEIVDRTGRRACLRAAPLPSPTHMLAALARFTVLSRAERLSATWAALRWMNLRRRRDPWLSYGTVSDLLDLAGQSERVRRYLWHPITVATMNEKPERAAAGPFVEVLARAFFGTRIDSQFVFARVGLRELYVDDAIAFLICHGGVVHTRTVAVSFERRGNEVTAVRSRDGREFPAQAVICAVPPSAAKSLLGDPSVPHNFEYSPIVSVHLRYDDTVDLPPFLGFVGTHTQWLFTRYVGLDGQSGSQNPSMILSAVISAAHEEATWDNDRLATTVRNEIEGLCPVLRKKPYVAARVIRERQATVSLTPSAYRARPNTRTSIANVFLAGDWVATGLPATIESAVASGRQAARAVLAWLEKEWSDRR